MRHRLFITGTDTGVGKTELSLALLQAAKHAGLSTAAMKPVAAGATQLDGEWKNEDAFRLQQACTLPLSYSEVNPVLLQQAIAPHLAAYRENRSITIERLLGLTQNVFHKKADFTVIEGAGGWRVPITHRELLSQYVQQLNLLQPKTAVVLVVGIRLGCINHSLLTAEAILRDNVPLAGWIANCVDPAMEAELENIQTLERLLPAPCLAIIPFQPTLDTATIAEKIRMELLLQRLAALQA